MARRDIATATRWIEQARDDHTTATRLQQIGIDYAACFFAQQAGEKALKGALFAIGFDPTRTHAIVTLATAIEAAVPSAVGLRSEVSLLDQYYIPTRYPDALPGGRPSSVYGRSDSTRALAAAARAVEVAGLILAAEP